jgi:hypothetical protein
MSEANALHPRRNKTNHRGGSGRLPPPLGDTNQLEDIAYVIDSGNEAEWEDDTAYVTEETKRRKVATRWPMVALGALAFMRITRHH